MGSKSLVGASAAIVLGLIIYNGYGRIGWITDYSCGKL